jgi:hypothetical protein
MAWGKIIGGALGAVFGGPIGAGIGIAIGAGIDEENEGAAQSHGAPHGEGGLILKQNGNVLQVTVALRVPDDATDVVARIQNGGQLVKVIASPFVDDNGHYLGIKCIKSHPITLDIPLHALAIARNEPQEITVLVGVRRDGENLGFSWGSGWVTIGFEPWSVIRWLAPAVDLLTTYALRYGPWTADKVRLIKSVFDNVTEDDADEMVALKDLIKRSGRPSVDECIATYNRRFDSEEVTAEILVGVASLLQLSGRSDDAVASEIAELGERLHLSLDALMGVLQYLEGGEDHEEEEDTADHADVQRACAVLGVTIGATRDTIQQAWRKKISELHPDKYVSLPEVVQTMIKEKAQELNLARDMLLKGH